MCIRDRVAAARPQEIQGQYNGGDDLRGDRGNRRALDAVSYTHLDVYKRQVLFTALAFWGTYDMPTLLSVALSSYVIFIFTSLLDTPVVYAARRLYEKKMGRAAQED